GKMRDLILQLSKSSIYSTKPRWAIKCKLIGDQVMWASDNPDSTGRWRDDPADSTVKYSIDGKKIIITELYTDGSSTTNSYPLMQLK
ncbi:hypothetical protein ACSJH2_21860, partial [Klebsiella pneumoniae]